MRVAFVIGVSGRRRVPTKKTLAGLESCVRNFVFFRASCRLPTESSSPKRQPTGHACGENLDIFFGTSPEALAGAPWRLSEKLPVFEDDPGRFLNAACDRMCQLVDALIKAHKPLRFLEKRAFIRPSVRRGDSGNRGYGGQGREFRGGSSWRIPSRTAASMFRHIVPQRCPRPCGRRTRSVWSYAPGGCALTRALRITDRVACGD